MFSLGQRYRKVMVIAAEAPVLAARPPLVFPCESKRDPAWQSYGVALMPHPIWGSAPDVRRNWQAWWPGRRN